ncbi:hypothetical protein GMD62_11820 [Pseudoflavonifractor sp. BIOML-A14]|nr:hypothetical protein [Pseudoflavonifractor sp. BIOML-A14]
MKQRFLSLALTLALCLGLAVPALAAEGDLFPATGTMPSLIDLSPDGPAAGEWYDYESVKVCVEAGLLKGSGMCFYPGNDITLAELATVAARIYEKTSGRSLPEEAEGDPWYGNGVRVMEELGLPLPADPVVPAARADFVAMLGAVLPDGMLSPINSITALPDTGSADVLRFYNAGILTGTDDSGTFEGDKRLSRAEAAAMIARIVRPSLRRRFTPAAAADGIQFGKMDATLPFTQALYQRDPLVYLNEEEFATFCVLAGIPQETVMLTFDGLGAVTAREYIPLLYQAIRSIEQDYLENGYDPEAFWTTSYVWYYLPREMPQHVKQVAVNYCTTAALKAEGVTEITAEDMYQFQDERNATLSQAAKDLDPQLFYEAILNS